MASWSKSSRFARPGAHLTRDFDGLLALACDPDGQDRDRPARSGVVAHRGVGLRGVAAELDPCRLDGLFGIGVWASPR